MRGKRTSHLLGIFLAFSFLLERQTWAGSGGCFCFLSNEQPAHTLPPRSPLTPRPDDFARMDIPSVILPVLKFQSLHKSQHREIPTPQTPILDTGAILHSFPHVEELKRSQEKAQQPSPQEQNNRLRIRLSKKVIKKYSIAGWQESILKSLQALENLSEETKSTGSNLIPLPPIENPTEEAHALNRILSSFQTTELMHLVKLLDEETVLLAQYLMPKVYASAVNSAVTLITRKEPRSTHVPQNPQVNPFEDLGRRVTLSFLQRESHDYLKSLYPLSTDLTLNAELLTLHHKKEWIQSLNSFYAVLRSEHLVTTKSLGQLITLLNDPSFIKLQGILPSIENYFDREESPDPTS